MAKGASETKVETLADRLRRAVRESGKTRYEIAKDAGLSWTSLARFLSGERDLSLDGADKLCRYFGLHLAPRENLEDAPCPV